MLYDGFQCEGYELEADAPLIAALGNACARVTGHAPPLFASTATTDARSFHLYGETPAVCFGPLAEREHGIDERVHVPSVTTTAQAIALFIADWCGLAELTAVLAPKRGAAVRRRDRCAAGGDGRAWRP